MLVDDAFDLAIILFVGVCLLEFIEEEVNLVFKVFVRRLVALSPDSAQSWIEEKAEREEDQGNKYEENRGRSLAVSHIDKHGRRKAEIANH